MKFHVQQFTKTRRLQLLMSVELWITQQADDDIHIFNPKQQLLQSNKD